MTSLPIFLTNFYLQLTPNSIPFFFSFDFAGISHVNCAIWNLSEDVYSIYIHVLRTVKYENSNVLCAQNLFILAATWKHIRLFTKTYEITNVNIAANCFERPNNCDRTLERIPVKNRLSVVFVRWCLRIRPVQRCIAASTK